jgi:hypothetical protein
MVGAVLGLRALLGATGVAHPLARLLFEMTVGAAVYVGAMLLMAPEMSRDFLGLAKKSLWRRAAA